MVPTCGHRLQIYNLPPQRQVLLLAGMCTFASPARQPDVQLLTAMWTICRALQPCTDSPDLNENGVVVPKEIDPTKLPTDDGMPNIEPQVRTLS